MPSLAPPQVASIACGSRASCRIASAGNTGTCGFAGATLRGSCRTPSTGDTCTVDVFVWVRDNPRDDVALRDVATAATRLNNDPRGPNALPDAG